MTTPGGHQMSVAMTNCGEAGWVTDRSGYRYDGTDPESGKARPAMPTVFRELAESAAGEAVRRAEDRRARRRAIASRARAQGAQRWDSSEAEG